MKRIWIALGILALVILSGCYSLWYVGHSTQKLSARLDILAEQVYRQADGGTLRQQTEALAAEWEEIEMQMMHFVNHSALDEVGSTVSQLSALATFGDYGELAAEIERLRHLVEHIAASERPSLSTVF